MSDPSTWPDRHTATITDAGAQDLTHPEGDPPDCDFEAYMAADWSNPHRSQLGPWWFFRMDDHWNGTPQPEEA